MQMNHQTQPNDVKPLTAATAGEAGDGEEEKKKPKSRSKEKSVLQAKLTRLAIQIGQVGKWRSCMNLSNYLS